MGPMATDAEELDYMRYLAEYCQSKNERLIVNMSYGSRVGPKDGSDVYSQALSALINKYDIVVTMSVGNDADCDIAAKHTLTDENDEMKGIWFTDESPILYGYLTTSQPTPINMDIVVYDTRVNSIIKNYPAIINGEAQNLSIKNTGVLISDINIIKESIHNGMSGYFIESQDVMLKKVIIKSAMSSRDRLDNLLQIIQESPLLFPASLPIGAKILQATEVTLLKVEIPTLLLSELTIQLHHALLRMAIQWLWVKNGVLMMATSPIIRVLEKDLMVNAFLKSALLVLF